MAKYIAQAVNEQGCITDVANGAEFTSINKAASAARAELGSGWHVYIMRRDWYDESVYGVETRKYEDVKDFTIR